MQENYRALGMRLRLLCERCTDGMERVTRAEGDWPNPMELEALAHAAMLALTLERQSANLDQLMKREAGWQ